MFARGFAGELKAGDRVLLNGPMGSGKSTFARALIKALGVEQDSEGSPSFAIAHEYGSIVHLDLYRLKSEMEIEEAGIPAYFWEGESIVLVEWLASFPGFEEDVLNKSGSRGVWSLSFSFTQSSEVRSLEIRKIVARPQKAG